MSEEIALNWLINIVDTLSNKDLKGHLNLISKSVSLTGIAGYENIDYAAWSAQCEHEFTNNLVKSLNYSGLKLLAADDDRIKFKTLETIEATDGTRKSMGIEVVIQKENDGVWRVIQERVLPDNEAIDDGLLAKPVMPIKYS